MIQKIHTIKDINQALNEEVTALVDWANGLSNEQFFTSVNEKWSTGEQIEHLRKSSKPLVIALKLPKFILTLKVGKPNRPSRTFDTVKTKYEQKLASRTITTTRFYPQLAEEKTKEQVLDAYLKTSQRLMQVIAKWSDDELDRYILPHPLLGKVTVREMLFFTIHHTRHHSEIVKQLYA